MNQIPEYTDNFPTISGYESAVSKILAERPKEVFKPESSLNFDRIKSSFAIALHMHQPLIPAGGSDLQTARLISNLEDMRNNPGVGDNHNWEPFSWCYKRLGTLIPELVSEGKEPRVMVEYSGTLLHGVRAMGLNDIIEDLKKITCDKKYRRCIEWLGCPWGHAVAPSTPAADYRRHVQAWQMHFAGIFGSEALSRVRGFSPSEMALPNHPDDAYEFVKTLRDCGFTWVMVQEHTVEEPGSGHSPSRPHIPHRLVCTNSEGASVSIIALIKTQGSDTKLVAQMQPYYEALSVGQQQLGDKFIPALVSQIADGENGGVMMNEFPGKFMEVSRIANNGETAAVNGTEYLEFLFASGVTEEQLPEVQPIFHKRIWERFTPGSGQDKLKTVIEELKKEDHRFHVEGGSWTGNISWVQGYENVLGPMEQASVDFKTHLVEKSIPTTDPRYREALFYLLSAQTSCYRYWGQGQWTDYGREICRRASAAAKR